MVKTPIEFEGKLYESKAELARQKGVVPPELVYQRLRSGMDLEPALLRPLNPTSKSEDDYHRLGEQKGIKWIGKNLPKSTETKTKWLCGNGHERNLTFKTVRDNGECKLCYEERIKHPDYVNPLRLTKSYYYALAEGKGWKWLGTTVPKKNSDETLWECDKGHIISKSYIGVTGSGCGTCYGDYKTAKGKRLSIKPPREESYAVTHPEIAAEWHPTKNGDLTPSDVTHGTNDEIWWVCPKSDLHDYQLKVIERTRGYNCPYCHGSRIAPDTCLAYKFPEIAAEWHPTKNGKITPFDVTWSSGQKVHWFCPLHPDKKWYVSPSQRTGRYRGCPHCARKTSRIEIRIYTELKTIFKDAKWPEAKILGELVDIFLPSLRIGIEYDSKYHHIHREKQDRRKNRILEKHDYVLLNLREEGLPLIGKYDVEVPVDGSQREVIQLLFSRLRDLVPKEDQEKIQSYLGRSEFVNDEEYREILAGLHSPSEGESFVDKHPKIAEFWDYEANSPLTPSMFTSGSEKVVWWKCDHKDYHPSFELNIKRRVNSTNYKCEYCWGKNKKVHERDSLKALYPDLLKDWDYEKNELPPEKVWPTWQQNNYRAFWICSECGRKWRSAPINRCSQGNGCETCKSREARKKLKRAMKQRHNEERKGLNSFLDRYIALCDKNGTAPNTKEVRSILRRGESDVPLNMSALPGYEDLSGQFDKAYFKNKTLYWTDGTNNERHLSRTPLWSHLKDYLRRD